MNTKCPVCLRRVWWFQKQLIQLGQKTHEDCHWKRYFAMPKAVRK